MNKKVLLSAIALAVLNGCSSGSKETGADTSAEETGNVQSYTVRLQGKWKLVSYSLDSEPAQSEIRSENYILSFDEFDNSFGLTTDCNVIGGGFEITNDTIRFKHIAVTEMACGSMTVEEQMLRLLNDAGGYALCNGNIIRYEAPLTGSARFKRAPVDRQR